MFDLSQPIQMPVIVGSIAILVGVVAIGLGVVAYYKRKLNIES